MDDEENGQDLPPSKSARKREAHALQKLGEELVKMRQADLDRLPLPENLREAIDEARRLTNRGALSRQRQYIGVRWQARCHLARPARDRTRPACRRRRAGGRLQHVL